MSYDYCCIYCGKKLNQENRNGVDAFAFDLSPVLSGGQALKTIKFRVTEEEILDWAPEMNRTYPVRLNPSEVFRILSKPFNHNKPAIAYLKLKDICAKESLPESTEEVAEDDDPFGFSKPAVIEPSEKMPGIDSRVLALFQGSNVSGGQLENRGIESELELYWDTAAQHADHAISIHIKREGTSAGTKSVEIPTLGVTVPRICPSCGSKVVEEAGDIPHRMVGFIANPFSAKTSTIIALSHYMMHAITGTPLQGGIWGGAKQINEVSETGCTIRIPQTDHISSQSLLSDLDRYGEGRAPLKTQDIVYNPTFLIESKAGTKSLLTLVDIPGELCPRQGDINNITGERIVQTKIQEKEMREKYQIILNCAAYITCFDTTAFSTGSADDRNIKLHAPVIWSEQIQQLRRKVADKTESQAFAPIMILLTKCQDLERDFPLTPPKHTFSDPLFATYMFAEDYQSLLPRPGTGNNQQSVPTLVTRAEKENDQQAIPMSTIREQITKAFEESGEALRKVFFAMLRCSPFGFEATGYNGALQEATIQDEGNDNPPRPKNIDGLTEWILRVTGCIPISGHYDPETGEDNVFVMTGCNIGPQSRDCSPKDDEEALARCILFVNPGYIDRRLVWYHPKQWRLSRWWFKLRRRYNKKISNLTEENL